MIGTVEYEYCQKCHRDMKFCPHKNSQRLQECRDQLKYQMTR